MRYIEAKSILSKLKEADPWFGIAYNMNLYRGCQHGCIYCDSRSECYRLGELSRVSVKANALEMLSRELRAKRHARATIGTGSMNDPYMPVEKELQLTRRALEILAAERFPVHIITKGDMVRRDTDILQELTRTYAAVSFTITCAADTLSAKVEPHAPVSSARFKALEILAAKGIYTGITLMPLLPFINDTEENIRGIVQQAKDSGASYILPMFGVTLRKGSREYFYQSLDHTFPSLSEKYRHTFGDRYMCYSPHYARLSGLFSELCAKYGIDTKMPFYTPPSVRQATLF